MPWHLSPLVGRKKGTEIPLEHLPLRIGRARDCQVRSLAGSVSRHHCALVEQDGHLFLQDLASRNGTFVNGRRVEVSVELHPDDVVQVGPLMFKVHGEEPASSTPQPPEGTSSKTFYIA